MPSDIPPWRPDRFAARRDKLAARTRMLAAIRTFFADCDFVEVDTPALQISPGLEPHLKAFATTIEEPGGASRRLFLHTSPEFAMKKLLAAGVPRLFQLAHVFRNGERSATHHPEFAMLEWYRAGAGYRDLMQDCEALLRAALAAAGADVFRWQGRSADPSRPWTYVSVADAFRDLAGIDLFATAPDPHRPDAAVLAARARDIGLATAPADSWEDVFFRIFLARIEPALGVGAPTILYDYPVSMAALARPKADAPHLAERFEVYVCGLELANAFGELTDAATQRARFEADRATRRRLYGETYPVDEDFLAALAHGLPESAGIALGFDRLVMLATGAERIDEVLWLPVA